MSPFTRRGFLESSLGGMAALALGSRVLGADEKSDSKDFDGIPRSPHDALFLTWQRDPTTTMTVQWIGEPTSDERSTVQYRPRDGKVWRTAKTIARPFPESDLEVFRCELTELDPGGEYTFRVGKKSAEYRFRTMPAKATNEICFVSGGDAGVSSHAVDSNKLAAAQDPQFVLMAGDLAYDDGKSPETFVKFVKNYTQTMVDSEGRLIPMIACFGNHEVKDGYNAKREDSTSFLPVFDGFYAEKTFGVLDIGDYLSLVLLDTGHVAPVAGEQTSWLESTLAARQERPHLIAVNHVPCYPSYRNPEASDDEKGTGEDQRKFWSPLYEKYRVDVVLEHHDHTFKRTHPLTGGHVDKNGVIYLGDGSWGKVRAPKSPEERPYLAKTGEAYHISVHKLQGDDRFHIALEESGKIADVLRTESKRPARRG